MFCAPESLLPPFCCIIAGAFPQPPAHPRREEHICWCWCPSSNVHALPAVCPALCTLCTTGFACNERSALPLCSQHLGRDATCALAVLHPAPWLLCVPTPLFACALMVALVFGLCRWPRAPGTPHMLYATCVACTSVVGCWSMLLTPSWAQGPQGVWVYADMSSVTYDACCHVLRGWSCSRRPLHTADEAGYAESAHG